MRLALVCFYCLCVFVYVLYFIATMSFAGYFLPVLFCMLSMLISDSRFDLVWFRLSCDHGWIRSGSVNVRKQQQQNNNRGKWSKWRHFIDDADIQPHFLMFITVDILGYKKKKKRGSGNNLVYCSSLFLYPNCLSSLQYRPPLVFFRPKKYDKKSNGGSGCGFIQHHEGN